MLRGDDIDVTISTLLEQATEQGSQGFSLKNTLVNETVVREAHSRLFSVFVWTVTTQDMMNNSALLPLPFFAPRPCAACSDSWSLLTVFALGVDGVITNNPRFAFSVPKDTNPSSEGYPAWQVCVCLCVSPLPSPLCVSFFPDNVMCPPLWCAGGPQLAVIVVGASLGSFVLGLTVLGLIVKCKSTQQRRSAGFQQV